MNAGRRVTELVVFAKDPRPGLVKTRMAPPLSPELAASFYAEMLADVLEESGRACRQLGLRGVLTVFPRSAAGSLAASAPDEFRVVAQSGRDLGARMANEVARSFATGAERVILRGSDNPALGIDELAAINEALDSVDVAASPDPDGGYGAIGLRRAIGDIFDHAMSTDEVLRSTLERAEARGHSTRTTRGSFDLDRVDDLLRLRDVRTSLPRHRCARTLAFADRHALWAKAEAL